MKIVGLLLLFFCTKGVAQSKCDEQALPIVFVHGFLASGDTWSTQIQRFSSNGYCDDRLFVFDWNTVGGRLKSDSLLEIFIADILKKTQQKQVNLVGHSAGGGLCFNFLKDSLRALTVARYVHVGSGKINGKAGHNGNVPTMNIYSTADKVVKSGEADHVVNIKLTTQDHLQVASSEETFDAIYRFFNTDKQPSSLHILPSASSIEIAGRAVTLGDNVPLANARIQLYAFDPVQGKRIGNKPLATLVTDELGYWQKVLLEKNTYVEMELQPVNGRVVSYFIEPPIRHNRNIYLRGIPTAGLAGTLLKGLPSKTQQSTVAVFSANQAMIYGRDSVNVNGVTLTSAALTPEAKTIIASFVYDDGDEKSSGDAIKTVGPGIFLNTVDVSIPASTTETFPVYFNGRVIRVPCRPGSEAVLVILFN